MNSGAEAVETAIKSVRKWGYEVKGVADGRAEIIVCANNFHGRTLGVISFSTDPDARGGFGPFAPGFKVIPFGDADALEAAIRSEEHKSELQSLMRISYAVFCLKKKKRT